jgi:Zn-dependent protease with chaperone function
VTKARGVFWLHAAVALAGLAATALALIAALRAVSFSPPEPATLLAACRSFALPQLSVASALTLVLGSVGFAVLALAIRAATRGLRAKRRFLNALDVVGPFGPRGALLFAHARPQAFCAGFLRPRVYVSTGALDALDEQELEAVLAHEHQHARLRDPLRVFCVRVLAEALFFLPALRRLADRYSSLSEIAADAAAVRASGGDRRPLASALLRFGEAPNPAVVSIGPERVDHLLGEPPRWELPTALLTWAIVAVAALVALAMRAADVTEHAALNLPLAAAQACMLAMTVLPVVGGATVLLASRRLLPAARRRWRA